MSGGLVPLPSHRGARIGLALFVALWALLGVIEWCRAAEVPPVIIGVREALRDARRVLQGTAPRHAQADAGGECVALVELEPFEEVEGLPTMVERVAVERQVVTCSRQPGRKADVWGLLALYRLEEQLGVPEEARGILGAIYCVEAGAMAGERRGDWRDGVARAHGPMQLHSWAYRLCGLTDGARDDLEASARCYWSRVALRHAEMAQGNGPCKPSWSVAEALVANAPRYAALGCAAKSAHWRAMEHTVELEGWR